MFSFANAIAGHSEFLAGAALMATLLVWRFDIHGKLSSFRSLKSKPEWGEFGAAGLTFYQFVSVAGGTVSFLVVNLLYTHFVGNPLLLRVGTGNGDPRIVQTAGHWTVWVALFLVFFRYGAFDIIKGAYAMGAFGAYHEGAWYISYFAAHPPEVAITLAHYWPFVVFVSIIIFGYWLNFRDVIIPKHRLIRMGLFLLVFMSMWVLAGFHVSLDNLIGLTQYYPSLDVAFIEGFSWLGLALVCIY